MEEANNPWTVLSRRTLYENDWIRLDHSEVVHRRGGQGIYGTVHFKNYALGVVPIDERGNVVLVGQYRFPLGAYSWEIPEGGGRKQTPVLESVQRELLEECGLVASCWLQVLGMDLSNSVSDESSIVFLAWNLYRASAQPEDTEELQVVRVPFWEALGRVKRGEIRDAMSVAALLRIALMEAQHELPDDVSKLISSDTLPSE